MAEKYVIIVAGGKGVRTGWDLPKQFLLLNGRPVLMHTITAFYDYDPQIRIILVLPEDYIAYWSQLCAEFRFDILCEIVPGGDTRFQSVQKGLEKVERGALVGVHDGVRPLIDKQLIAKVYEAAATWKGAYPVIPLIDSIRELDSGGESHSVGRTKYRLVQTPQVFKSDILIDAYKQEYKDDFTDDVSVVEATRMIHPIMVEGSPENIKITAAVDLMIAETLIRCRI
ncbi:MAG: 2-C-methyl-D-erythritol 4-phosphate cytidylyltransferase [Candidatus Azobacteroides sp.]|nr:2-C-methyl-D-erythritol 4-phosphate cytidylyltransferase [Candidatus Azobacteroides sp.]